MKTERFVTSHFGTQEIPVEFLVLHYTGCSLRQTLQIFGQSAARTCAHYVIDEDGTVLELSPPQGEAHKVYRGAHAGVSRFVDAAAREFRGFNEFAIGVELVNLNGNLFPYPDAQMNALIELTRELQTRHPQLRSPARVVGHEHIAGFRGKSDPGLRFDWVQFYGACYPGLSWPQRASVAPESLVNELRAKIDGADPAQKTRDEFWMELSSWFEEQCALNAPPAPPRGETRLATLADLDAVNALIAAAKSHWNYPADYLRAALPLLRVEPAQLQSQSFWLLEHAQEIIGVYAFDFVAAPPTLDHFWIHPKFMRQGHGRALWSAVLRAAAQEGLKSFLIVADPGAEPFYLAMGAVRVGQRPSRVPGGPEFPVLEFRAYDP